MQPKKVFIIIAIFWVVIIAGFIGYKEYTLRTGTEVILKTVPVDPKDLFRGNFVVLRYEISTIPSSLISNDPQIPVNSTLYVSLDKGADGYYRAASASLAKPDKGLFLKGKVVSNHTDSLGVEYGIESYFISEEKSKNVDFQSVRRPDGRVKIDKFGTGVLENILLDGKEI